MNKIYISGCSGFVGKNLLAFLNQKEVECISRDLLENNSFTDFLGAEAIIHLAGKAHDLKKVSDPNEYYHVNYELTKKLYDSFVKSDVKKFIFISSVKAVADSVEHELLENDEPNPTTDYGKSKLMAERYIQSQPLPYDKSYYILRPCMIHGPGNKGNLNLLYQFVKKGIPYPLASFANARSFLSIENFCFVILNLLNKKVTSGIYNIADDRALSTNDVVKILAQSSNKKPRLYHIPCGVIRTFAKAGDILGLKLNTHRLTKLTESYIVNNTKIKEALNLSLPITTEEGLILTANSFKDSSL